MLLTGPQTQRTQEVKRLARRLLKLLGVLLLIGLAGIATFREIGLGVKLSLSYSKPQILAMYLNALYYGPG